MNAKKYSLIQKIFFTFWIPIFFIIFLWSGDPMSLIELIGEVYGLKKPYH